MNVDTKVKAEITDPATCLELDGTAKAGQCGCTPRSNLTTLRRLESSEDIERALHISSDRVQRQIRWFGLVLAGLVSMSIVLAAVVWWRLLT